MARIAPFHLQQNTDLNVIEQTLRLGRQGSIELSTLADRTGKTEDDFRKRIFAFLRQLGILSGVELAPFGKRLAIVCDERPELLGEALHLRLATLHYTRSNTNFSFAYEAVGDWLWERGDYLFKDEARSELVGIVIEYAARTFGVDAGSVAFSKTSINGASHFMAGVDPPVLNPDTDRFRRRHAAPAFSVLWAVDALYRAQGLEWGTRLSLGDPQVTRLCQWLLLEPDALTATLALCSRTEGGRKPPGQMRWLTVGVEGGYGRWLVLSAPCPVGAISENLPPNLADPFAAAAALDHSCGSSNQIEEVKDLEEME